jgi:hypothetical protein
MSQAGSGNTNVINSNISSIGRDQYNTTNITNVVASNLRAGEYRQKDGIVAVDSTCPILMVLVSELPMELLK